MKKNSHQLVEDLLSNRSGLNANVTPEELTKFIESNYDVNVEELQLALKSHRGKIEDLIGVPITDEQLTQLTGGKSETAKIGIGIGGGAAAGSVGAAIGVAVFIGLYALAK